MLHTNIFIRQQK